MKVFETDKIKPGSLSIADQLYVYNGLDCCLTREVKDAILPQLDNHTAATYNFSRELQGPVLEMDLKGLLVDETERQHSLQIFKKRLDLLEMHFNTILRDGIGAVCEWNSPAQVAHLFYKVLQIPEYKNHKTGKPSVDRKNLEKIRDAYFFAGPLVRFILAMREIKKAMGVLKTEIDRDGRIRSSYNIAGTETGRFSASSSAFDSGTNLQNITNDLRRPFVSDPGMKMAYVDLSQAESFLVGAIIWNLSSRGEFLNADRVPDGLYLDACESGDLHTMVSKMVWPDLPWTSSKSEDRTIADRLFYRHWTYRDLAKRGGHGTNYYGKPETMAMHLNVERSLMADFQPRYFRAFPGIRNYHYWTAKQLQVEGYITSLMGRKRWFFGRRDDDSTLREAIAYNPQEGVATILNTGMLQVWRANVCQLLSQQHDAILIQYPAEREDEIIPQVRSLIQVNVPLERGRILSIPNDVKTGWNWAEAYKTDKEGKPVLWNPDGMMKFKGHDERRRRNDPSVPLLDRVFS